MNEKVFLEGPAGTGKTTAAVHMLERMVIKGVDSGSILILLPQRTLAAPYTRTLAKMGFPDGGVAGIMTLAGLARRMVDLFWPLVVEEAGFERPDKAPVFLNMETAQYFMARVVRPLFSRGFFESVTIHRNRLYSQILDNLNKSAVVGFPYTTIAARLKSAWKGEPGQARVYDDAQECAVLFRRYCLEHNLLDFSLQIEVFAKHIWTNQLCRAYLCTRYKHLFFDNLEEDTPITHDLIREWLPQFESALLIFDQDGGYRRFLGADPVTGKTLKDVCGNKMVFTNSFTNPPELEATATHFGRVMNYPVKTQSADSRADSFIKGRKTKSPLVVQFNRYYPQMLDWVAETISHLIHNQKISPGEIVVLAPYLSDSLRFSLIERLHRFEIPTISHRPSRPLREEPAAQCLLTLATLAHPEWEIRPSKYEVVYALIEAVEGMDLVRAQLLTEIVYRTREGQPVMTPFSSIKADFQERITYTLGERFDHLRNWIEDYRQDPLNELDHFFSRLFGEVLSQTGYGFHFDYRSGGIVANLIESARKFRQVMSEVEFNSGKSISQEYIEMVYEGVVAAQYIGSWDSRPGDAVFLSPAYTFLMSNRPVEFQFWLDIGSTGW
ncbi:MAG: DEAD/DEAH box helicase family protein, partial [Anaerolineales bacterium]